MFFQQVTFTFAFITTFVFFVWMYLYLTHRQIRSFLHASLFMLCGSTVLITEYCLQLTSTPHFIILWSKFQYVGIFGFMYAFPRFVYDLIEKKIPRRLRLTLLILTYGTFLLTVFTNLIIGDQIVTSQGFLDAGKGVLYPLFTALAIVISAFYVFKIVINALRRPVRTFNYFPIVISVGLGTILSLLDTIGIIMGKIIIPGIQEPFIIGLFIICLGFLWTYISQYSWVLSALDKSEKELSQLVDRSNQSFVEFVEMMAKTLDAKDHYTAGHSLRVMDYSVKIGRTLRLSEVEIEVLKQACLLHDIGKIKIPDGILNKKSPLSDKDREFIYLHPVVGRQILSTVSDFQSILDIIYTHHERVDGRGYPRGLKKEEIPLLARIISVADAYDAMRSERPYRRAKTKAQATIELERVKGTQLDPAIVEAFLDIVAADNIG
jgi:putative nucleotidyltransferase with HDIG domain